MRDAFGGSFMIKLFIVFIFIYVFFIAIALNYAKAFKVKNKVIEYIETHEIVDLDKMSAKAKNEMELYMQEEIYDKLSYSYTDENNYSNCPNHCRCFPGITVCEATEEKGETDQRFLLGRKNAVDTGTTEKIYAKTYKVTVKVPWEASFINKLLQLNGESGGITRGVWEITGETRLIASEE